MEQINVKAPPRFIAQAAYVRDVGRGGQIDYDDPVVYGVYDGLEEAFEVLRLLKAGNYGLVLEVRNPILVDGELIVREPKVHRLPVEEPPKAVKKKPAKKAAAARKGR